MKRYIRPTAETVWIESVMALCGSKTDITMGFESGDINGQGGAAKTNGFETDWDEDYEEDDLYGCLK